ncbi:MAG: alpha/beta fold hydrolase [Nanoarchaeota archaeon]|nr:alpha/beta fold hydrolase [Nanoarchaeota archaeon]
METKQEQIETKEIHVKKALLVHGFNGSPDVFKEIRESLEERGILVYTVRYESTKPFQDWIKIIENKIKEIGNSEEIILVGHSLGGSLSLYLSQRHKFKGLVLINSPVYLKKGTLFKVLVKFFNKRKEVEIRKVKYSMESIRSIFSFLDELKGKTVINSNSTLIIQSKKDYLVSNKSAKMIYNKINSENKQLVNIGSGHTPLNQPVVISSIMGFMGVL